MGLLSTHADRQGVDISVTVCLCVCLLCVFVWLRLIKLVAPNFAQWFLGVLDTESLILGNFAPQTLPKIGRIGQFWSKCVLIAQRYNASAVYAVIVCPSVCLSVRHKPSLYKNG